MTGAGGGPDTGAGRLLELIGGSWAAQVVRTAAVLGLADALAEEPQTVDELADAVDADPAALGRLVNALCTLDLMEPVGDRFAMTATGALLRSGDGSLGPWAQWWGGPAWEEWAALPEVVRTGRSARAALGDDGFDRLRSDPARSTLFDAAMAGLTRLDAPAIIEALGLAGTERVADVGGGRGELLAAVLEHHPAATGVVVDVPGVQAGADALLAERGLSDRGTAVAADVFEAVPPGADVYLLKSVLHDWDDGDALRILRRCGDALRPEDRLCLVERIVPAGTDSSAAARSTARMDLHMMVAQGGRERTEAEWRVLIDAAGLVINGIWPISATSAVIDARRAGQPS